KTTHLGKYVPSGLRHTIWPLSRFRPGSFGGLHDNKVSNVICSWPKTIGLQYGFFCKISCIQIHLLNKGVKSLTQAYYSLNPSQIPSNSGTKNVEINQILIK